MCLQWCHVNKHIINNDERCDHCVRSRGWPHAAEACYSCRHRVLPVGDKTTWCALTRMPLPKVRTCCHWNASIDAGSRTITLYDIAPGLAETIGATTIAGVFADFDSAPEVVAAEEGIVVQLDDLALPDVYGTPSYDWFDAFDK